MSAQAGLLVMQLVEPVILGILDRMLLEVHAGQALIGLFVLAMLMALPLKSAKILAINVVLFGFIFLLTPYWVIENPQPYLFAGILMLIIGTMWFAYAER